MHPAELFRHDSDGVELAKGETLFHEGDRGDSMYVLLEGSADVRVGETLVESATPGALVGEMTWSIPVLALRQLSRRSRVTWPKLINGASISSCSKRPILRRM